MSDTTLRLHSKLADVIAEVGYVAKDGKNEFQNYRYTSAEALLAAIRTPLAARKVVLVPSLTAISEREYTTSKGKASIVTTAHVKFTLVDGETGEREVCEWAGQGDDPADKGLGKAYTNAIKTFLREQFLIPQGDDPEADSRTDERAQDRAPARRGNGAQRPQEAAQPPSRPRVDPDSLDALRRRFKDTGWTPETLAMQLTAVGAGDVSDVRAAMQALSPEQARQLLSSMNSAVDEQIAAEEALQEARAARG